MHIAISSCLNQEFWKEGPVSDCYKYLLSAAIWGFTFNPIWAKVPTSAL